MLRSVLFISAFIATSLAQLPGFGGCPDAKPIDNLDVNRYLGKWYELYKMPNLFEKGEVCITANYSLKADGHIQVYNSGYTNGKKVWAIGDAYVPDATKPSQLTVKFTNGSPYAPYWVLDTDYDNYTVIFSCESLAGIANIEFAWILGRKNSISDSLKDKLFKVLESNGIGTGSLKATVQNCGANV